MSDLILMMINLPYKNFEGNLSTYRLLHRAVTVTTVQTSLPSTTWLTMCDSNENSSGKGMRFCHV